MIVGCCQDAGNEKGGATVRSIDRTDRYGLRRALAAVAVLVGVSACGASSVVTASDASGCAMGLSLNTGVDFAVRYREWLDSAEVREIKAAQ
jgi:hypothetical protein